MVGRECRWGGSNHNRMADGAPRRQLNHCAAGQSSHTQHPFPVVHGQRICDVGIHCLWDDGSSRSSCSRRLVNEQVGQVPVPCWDGSISNIRCRETGRRSPTVNLLLLLLLLLVIASLTAAVPCVPRADASRRRLLLLPLVMVVVVVVVVAVMAVA